MLKILKGDDTGGVFGRRLVFEIDAPGVDMSGCHGEFELCGFVKRFDGPLVNGETREIFYSHKETGAMRLGVHQGRFTLVDAAGKRATVVNTVPVKVTDCVAEVYTESRQTIAIHGAIKWSDIEQKPNIVMTVNGLVPDANGNIDIPVGSGSGSAEGVVRVQHVDQVAEGSTMKEIRDAVNTIAKIISGGAAALAVLATFGASHLEDIPGDVDVYTAEESDARIAAATNAISPQSIGAQDKLDDSQMEVLNGGPYIGMDGGTVYGNIYSGGEVGANAVSAEYSMRKGGKEVATEEQVDELSATVSAWQTYWDGDDVRVTVTNYYGAMDIPSLYIEQKMATDDEHENTWFKIIWDERTRWNAFLADYTAMTNHVQNDLADRAWGIYDSSSGAYSPDGLLQLSQEQIMIAPGMSYQKTVTAGGCAVWVLKSTGPTMMTGETETGYFRIQDGDGNALFEIVKGDKRVVGATATGISVDGGVMTISYNSVSDEHPTLEICTDLKLSDWATETETTAATVSWSGSSGAWVATVTPVGARASLFAKATFEAGGNTYIKNNVATSIDKVVVGGIEYAVTVETINGKKMMVLR